MHELLIVGCGSFIGGVGRYYISLVTNNFYNISKFPTGTFLVNFIGCLLIGVLSQLIESTNLRLFLIVGLLGGFTTFSAFGLETISLFRASDSQIGMLYVLLSVLSCLFAVWLGCRLSGNY